MLRARWPTGGPGHSWTPTPTTLIIFALLLSLGWISYNPKPKPNRHGNRDGRGSGVENNWNNNGAAGRSRRDLVGPPYITIDYNDGDGSNGDDSSGGDGGEQKTSHQDSKLKDYKEEEEEGKNKTSGGGGGDKKPRVVMSDADACLLLLRKTPDIATPKLAPRSELVRTLDTIVGLGWDDLRNEVMSPVFVTGRLKKCRVSPDGLFLLPDGVVAVMVQRSQLDARARTYRSQSEYSRGITTELGGSGSMPVPDQPEITVSGSFSIKHEDMKSGMNSKDSVFFHTSLVYHAYKLEADEEAKRLGAGFRARIGEVVRAAFLNHTQRAKLLAELVVRDYGTHVVTTANVGAVIEREDYVQVRGAKNNNSVVNGLSLTIGASFSKGMFENISASIPFSYDESNVRSSTFSSYEGSTRLRTIGGPSVNEVLGAWKTNKDVKLSGGSKKKKDTNGDDKDDKSGKDADDKDFGKIDNPLTRVENFVPFDVKGVLLSDLIHPANFPEYADKPFSIHAAYEFLRRAIKDYYLHNTLYGCTDPNSDNFDYEANIDDGTCNNVTNYNNTFGGFYQTCEQEMGQDDCDNIFQAHPYTDDYRCPAGYSSIRIFSLRHEFPAALQSERYDYVDRVKIELFECRLTDQAAANQQEVPPALFGGAYSTVHPVAGGVNPLTGGRYCPTYHKPLHIGVDSVLCVNIDSTKRTEQNEPSIPFSSFFSCQSETRACAEGFTQHLISVLSGCPFYYCSRRSVNEQLGPEQRNISRPIHRPPYTHMAHRHSRMAENTAYAYYDGVRLLALPFSEALHFATYKLALHPNVSVEMELKKNMTEAEEQKVMLNFFIDAVEEAVASYAQQNRALWKPLKRNLGEGSPAFRKQFAASLLQNLTRVYVDIFTSPTESQNTTQKVHAIVTDVRRALLCTAHLFAQLNKRTPADMGMSTKVDEMRDRLHFFSKTIQEAIKKSRSEGDEYQRKIYESFIEELASDPELGAQTLQHLIAEKAMPCLVEKNPPSTALKFPMKRETAGEGKKVAHRGGQNYGTSATLSRPPSIRELSRLAAIRLLSFHTNSTASETVEKMKLIEEEEEVTTPKLSEADECIAMIREKPRSPTRGDNIVRTLDAIIGLGWDDLRHMPMSPMLDTTSFSRCGVTPDGQFLVPDGVVAVMVQRSQLDSMARAYRTHKEYTSSVIWSMGMSAEPVLPGDEQPSTISGSFSYKSEEVKSSMHEKSSVLLHTSLVHHAYRLEVDEGIRRLDDGFRARVDALKEAAVANLTKKAELLAEMLVRDYGTHVVTTANVGASVEREDYVGYAEAMSNTTSMKELRLKAAAAFSKENLKDAPANRSGNFGYLQRDMDMSSYTASLTNTRMRTTGGPSVNEILSAWNDVEYRPSSIENLVALDVKGFSLLEIISREYFPRYTRLMLNGVRNAVRKAVRSYYLHNTIYGCTNPLHTKNFLYEANVDDGSCIAQPDYKTTLSGVFQTCKEGLFTPASLCDEFEQKNAFTGNFDCGDGEQKVQIFRTEHHFPPQYLLDYRIFGDHLQFFELHYTAIITFYECRLPMVESGSAPAIFGGIFGEADSKVPYLNPLTGERSCPRGDFHAQRVGFGVTMCISRNDGDKGLSAPFSHFYSCQSPFAERRCPEGLTPYLAEVIDGCSVYFCTITSEYYSEEELRKKRFSRPIRRPPYTNMSHLYSEQPDHVVYEIRGEVVTINVTASEALRRQIQEKGHGQRPPKNGSVLATTKMMAARRRSSPDGDDGTPVAMALRGRDGDHRSKEEEEEKERQKEHDRHFNEWMGKLHAFADWASERYDRFEEEHPLEWEAYRSRMEGGTRESRESARRELEKKLGIIEEDEEEEEEEEEQPYNDDEKKQTTAQPSPVPKPTATPPPPLPYVPSGGEDADSNPLKKIFHGLAKLKDKLMFYLQNFVGQLVAFLRNVLRR